MGTNPTGLNTPQDYAQYFSDAAVQARTDAANAMLGALQNNDLAAYQAAAKQFSDNQPGGGLPVWATTVVVDPQGNLVNTNNGGIAYDGTPVTEGSAPAGSTNPFPGAPNIADGTANALGQTLGNMNVWATAGAPSQAPHAPVTVQSSGPGGAPPPNTTINGASPVAQIQNVTRPGNSTFQVGDTLRVWVNGLPNQPVSVSGRRDSGPFSAMPMGNTDASGNWTKDFVLGATDTGGFVEYWSVGGATANAVSFTVVAPAPTMPASSSSPAGSTTPPPPANNPGANPLGPAGSLPTQVQMAGGGSQALLTADGWNFTASSITKQAMPDPALYGFTGDARGQAITFDVWYAKLMAAGYSLSGGAAAGAVPTATNPASGHPGTPASSGMSVTTLAAIAGLAVAAKVLFFR